MSRWSTGSKGSLVAAAEDDKIDLTALAGGCFQRGSDSIAHGLYFRPFAQETEGALFELHTRQHQISRQAQGY